MNKKDALTKEIDRARPDRYLDNDRDWLHDVADRMALTQIELRTIAREYMRRLAREIEGQATKGGNRLMRHFHETRQLPLDWQMYANLPIAFKNKQIVDGQEVTVYERVKLAKATARDFELWAECEEQARQRDYKARGNAVSGALQIALEMKTSGSLTFGAWANSFANVDEPAA
ncbi:MAG: hypothetical protein SPK00_07870 [Corynebacterium glucuronolyticum]|nr:hypothetical protein [Mycobacteriaceae bacterium]MDY5834649.1 hypothetical protein [Corynebacterium glucuronolyticum]